MMILMTSSRYQQLSLGIHQLIPNVLKEPLTMFVAS